MVAERGLPAVIVNPSTPIGPRDIKPTPDRPDRARGGAAAGSRPSSTPASTSSTSTTSPRAICWRWRRAGSASATSWAARTCRCARCWPRSPRLTGRKAPTLSLPRAPLYPLAFAAEAVGPGHRQGAVPDPRRAEDGLAPHVLLLGQGRARARLQRAAATARRWPTRSPGSARRGTWRDRVAAHRRHLPLAVWLYLLLGRGFFWLARERDDREPAARARRLAGRRRRGPGAQRGRRDRALDRQPAGAGLSGRVPRRPGRRRQRRRHRRASPPTPRLGRGAAG